MLLFSFNFYSSSKNTLWCFPIKQSAISKFGLFCICCLLKIGGDSCQEIPLSQLSLSAPPTSGTNTMKTLICPGAPEYQNQAGDSVRRLASKVSFHLLIDFQYVRKPLTWERQSALQSLLGMPVVSWARTGSDLGHFWKTCTFHNWRNQLPTFSTFQVITWILLGLRKSYVKNLTSVLCAYGKLGSFTCKRGRMFPTGRCSVYLPKSKILAKERR